MKHKLHKARKEAICEVGRFRPGAHSSLSGLLQAKKQGAFEIEQWQDSLRKWRSAKQRVYQSRRSNVVLQPPKPAAKVGCAALAMFASEHSISPPSTLPRRARESGISAGRTRIFGRWSIREVVVGDFCAFSKLEGLLSDQGVDLFGIADS